MIDYISELNNQAEILVWTSCPQNCVIIMFQNTEAQLQIAN